MTPNEDIALNAFRHISGLLSEQEHKIFREIHAAVSVLHESINQSLTEDPSNVFQKQKERFKRLLQIYRHFVETMLHTLSSHQSTIHPIIGKTIHDEIILLGKMLVSVFRSADPTPEWTKEYIARMNLFHLILDALSFEKEEGMADLEARLQSKGIKLEDIIIADPIEQFDLIGKNIESIRKRVVSDISLLSAVASTEIRSIALAKKSEFENALRRFTKEANAWGLEEESRVNKSHAEKLDRHLEVAPIALSHGPNYATRWIDELNIHVNVILLNIANASKKLKGEKKIISQFNEIKERMVLLQESLTDEIGLQIGNKIRQLEVNLSSPEVPTSDKFKSLAFEMKRIYKEANMSSKIADLTRLEKLVRESLEKGFPPALMIKLEEAQLAYISETQIFLAQLKGKYLKIFPRKSHLPKPLPLNESFSALFEQTLKRSPYFNASKKEVALSAADPAYMDTFFSLISHLDAILSLPHRQQNMSSGNFTFLADLTSALRENHQSMESHRSWPQLRTEPLANIPRGILVRQSKISGQDCANVRCSVEMLTSGAMIFLSIKRYILKDIHGKKLTQEYPHGRISIELVSGKIDAEMS